MPIPDSLLQLIDQFHNQLTSYRSSDYNEAQARNEFIEPFFDALGWDVYNRQGIAYAYKDVIYEDSIKVAGGTKAPDYAFRIGGTRKFFVEAKKPSVNLKDEISPAYQLRRYAWSAHLPLSLLTDFEEFAVYDCRPKPDKSDKASNGRIMLLTYRDYPSHWDELYAIFSKPAVLKGSFDQFAETAAGKHGTAEVDDAFLSEIERWRDLLAHNIALRNPTLSQRDLNYAVQMTIDRLIFLRICEDRHIEFYSQLQSLLNGGDTYARLCQLFHKADERYNSGLFHFHPEPGEGDAPDTLTPNLVLDDKPLKDILAKLYYPDSPYEFSVLPADILGQVYERFLGKVIRLTAGHRAVVEDKPEVKKAGGVFYTPTFIVDYIVKNTLGKLLEGKALGQMGVGRGTPIRVLDMSCGSGSFLIGAYQYLLDWYLSGYTLEPEKWSKGASPRIYQISAPDGVLWKLTTSERKRILLDHIYGVDIDSQAVEVTKLSLLLKVLEGESEESIGKQLSMFRERALPNLAHNIKCGNSLIGPDFYTAKQSTFINTEEQYRINAFDWHREFAEVFASSGGFDVIIGNPPYGADLSRDIEYLLSKFTEAKKFPDSYCLFILKAHHLLKQNGKIGFVVPNTFCDLESCDSFRLWFLKNNILTELYQTGWAFKDAIVDTVVFIAEIGSSNEDNVVLILINGDQHRRYIGDFLHNNLFKIDYRNSQDNIQLLNKLKVFPAMSNFTTAKAGVKLYEIGKGIPPQTNKTLIEKPFTKKDKVSDSWFPLIRGGYINRYSIRSENEFVNYGPWLAAPRSIDLFESPKLLIRRTDDKLKSCIEYNSAICVNSCHVIKLNTKGQKEISYEYLLGLLNSKLLQRLFEIQNPQMVGKVFAEIKLIYVERLPIRPINFSKSIEKTYHDKMVLLVEQILAYQMRLSSASSPQDKEMIKRQIEVTDHQIDVLVYQLYGLTDEEIKLVEGG